MNPVRPHHAAGVPPFLVTPGLKPEYPQQALFRKQPVEF